MKKKIRIIGVIGIFGVIGIALSSCNVTRTITTKSEYQQKGDTTVIIQSKTIEQYDASKR